MRVNRRRAKWTAIAIVATLVLGTLLLAPAQAGRGIKGSYRAFPKSVRDAVPNDWEQGAGNTIDEVTRFFAGGDPTRLIDFDLRLEYASVAPGAWSPRPEIQLNWTDLKPGITYEVTVGSGSRPGSNDTAAGRFERPSAAVPLPGDGAWYVHVRPHSGATPGHATTFGPFRVDSTPPPAPLFHPIPPPQAYAVRMAWDGVRDDSGIFGYQIERLGPGTAFAPIDRVEGHFYLEDQIGNGRYQYRIRAINRAGLLGAPSEPQDVEVRAPMQNPGPGRHTYGIHANYTSFLQLWDLARPDRYARLDEVSTSLRSTYLTAGWGIEIQNLTLIQKTREVVGTENNTFRIAERLFAWLYDWADYDTAKLEAVNTRTTSGLQRANETYERRLGICGDLATLYLTMLRIAGVPARPVHGYLDNPHGNPPIGDFHVWVEVWVGASLRKADPTDTSEDWMPVDVSGITGSYDTSRLMIYFGLFNPDYLALGIETEFPDSNWNTWAQFAWSRREGTQPRFDASGRPVEVASQAVDLYFRRDTRERVVVPHGASPPPGFLEFYPDLKSLSKKRIDYGVDLDTTNGTPVRATIGLRYPRTDAFANTLPWQSVIYTVYTRSATVDLDAATGKTYKMLPDGTVEWTDDYR